VVPGGEIVVNRNHPLDHAHEDVYVAMRDSFDAARRQLEDHVRHLRGAVKPHAPRAIGRVTQVFPLQGYGFLAAPDGREIYFHQHAISEHDFRMLEIGSEVHFSEEEGDQGPQAAHVQLVHPHTHAARRGHV
jgi:cold shock CspA family protein